MEWLPGFREMIQVVEQRQSPDFDAQHHEPPSPSIPECALVTSKHETTKLWGEINRHVVGCNQAATHLITGSESCRPSRLRFCSLKH